ncbi:MAG TPA: acylphosphatase [Candidatus Limnocylindrales bacterium]|nr:acylphosphatase [Candidatus Limnocylindrales bacterium]
MSEPESDRTTPDVAGGSRSRLDAVVLGRVHGVGFRVHVRRAARALWLTGWVANEPGGRVHCVAEGPRESLERLLEILREGPPGAFVEAVQANWPPATGEFTEFGVRSGWHGGD